jgi:hypothetical protein
MLVTEANAVVDGLDAGLPLRQCVWQCLFEFRAYFFVACACGSPFSSLRKLQRRGNER